MAGSEDVLVTNTHLKNIYNMLVQPADCFDEKFDEIITNTTLKSGVSGKAICVCAWLRRANDGTVDSYFLGAAVKKEGVATIYPGSGDAPAMPPVTYSCCLFELSDGQDLIIAADPGGGAGKLSGFVRGFFRTL